MNTRNEGQSSTLGLVVLLVIVLAIGFIAVVTNIKRSNYGGEANASTTPSAEASTTASTSVSVQSPVSVPSHATNPSAQTQTKTQTQTQTQTTGQNTAPSGNAVIVNITPPAAESPNYRICTANDLTGTASWQGATGSLLGTLVITNSSRSNCSLSHDDYLQIMAGNSVLPVGQLANESAGAYTDLAPGYSARLNFLWSNWCNGSLSSNAYARLILPQNGGYLRVPLIDSGGHAQSDSPRCDNSSLYSTVSIWR